MARTNPGAVQGILGDNYGSGIQGSTPPDLQQFIDAATVIIDRVLISALNKGKPLTIKEAELVERWLSAHFYQMNDPGYVSRSTSGASGSFDGGTGEGFEGTRYGRMAIRLDYSNTLRNIDKQQRVTAAWLGKTKREQVDYDKRN